MYKKLHEFKLTKKEFIDVEEISTNEKGEQTKTLKKQEQEIPYSFFLRKPNRVLNDDATLFFGVEVSNGIKRGMLSIPQLEKRNLNDGGILSETDKTRYVKLLEENVSLENEFQKLSLDKEKAEDKEKLGAKITQNRVEIHRLQNLSDSAYDHTAEVRARNLTLIWWLLFLAYEEKDGKQIPYFGDGSYEDRIKKYDDLAEKEDVFVNQTLLKFLTYISLWFNNKSLTSEDFAKFEKLLEEDLKSGPKSAPSELEPKVF